MKTFNLIDVRQTPEYAQFMKKIGWQVIKFHNIYIFIKKLLFLPISVVKILRCQLLTDKASQIKYNQIKERLKKYHPLLINIQPFIISSTIQKQTLNKHPLIPTKTIWLNLKKNEHQLLSKMKPKTRYNIHLSQKKKIDLKIIPGNKVNNQQLKDFYSIWKKNKPFNWLFRPNFNELKWLVQSFKEKCFFVFAKPPKSSNSTVDNSQQQLLAGVLILQSINMAFYWHNCSNQQGKKLFAPTLCLWTAIQEAKKRNLKIFDFEGIYDSRFSKSQKHWQGFSRFKKGFGGKEIIFQSGIINGRGKKRKEDLV